MKLSQMSQAIQNMIGDSAVANKKTVEIPMEFAVKIAFALGKMDQIVTIAEGYIKLEEQNEKSTHE